jgi:hypothetical protein
MVELNTIAARKWEQDFSGATPTLDTTDGVAVGDIAVDTSTTPDKVWKCYDNTNGSPIWRASSTSVDGIVYVATDGSDTSGNGSKDLPYASIKAALASITDASDSNRYAIKVAPGRYSEVNPIQMKQYVNIWGEGGLQQTEVLAANPGFNLFNSAADAGLYHLVLKDVSGSDAYALDIDVAGLFVLRDCSIAESTNGVHINNVGALVDIKDLSAYNAVRAMTCFVKADAGRASIESPVAVPGSTVTNMIHASTSDTLLFVTNLTTDSNEVTNALLIENEADVTLNGARITGDLGDRIGSAVKVRSSGHCDVLSMYVQHADYGIDADDGAHIHIAAAIIDGCDRGIWVGSTGTSRVEMGGGAVSNSLTYDVELLSVNATFLASGVSIDENKLYLNGANAIMAHVANNEDDEGLGIKGELHVGSPEKGTESCLGEGDSYTRGLLAYTYDGTNYEDISGKVRSPSASAFTFPNTSVNTAIYLASDIFIESKNDYHKFFGIKMSLLRAQIGGTVVTEYWNGTAWADVHHMTTQSAGAYLRKGESLFTNAPGSYQVRFNPFMETDWGKNDPIGTIIGNSSSSSSSSSNSSSSSTANLSTSSQSLSDSSASSSQSSSSQSSSSDSSSSVAGKSSSSSIADKSSSSSEAPYSTVSSSSSSSEDSERYWIRFRITSSPTELPEFEQFKLHANRTEINADGFMEYMGKARPYKGTAVNWNSFSDAGAALADQDLWLTTNCKVGLSNNNFNSDGDSVGAVFTLPSEIDTSAPLRLRASVVSAGSGSLTMTAYLNKSSEGDAISTTDPVSTTGETSVASTKTVTAGQQEWFEFDLDISQYGIEASEDAFSDTLWINLEATTRPGNVYGLQFGFGTLHWKDGTHVGL